ncbi:MAG TPA: ATP-binding cassette domain-containing protein, partial [Solimonas sp.]|nr:ATP-binding cassette domain-containing protein [Solimonas sp.]
RIEFRDVRLRYSVDAQEALRGVSFTVEPGQTVAFVGKSGGGKSSLLALLPRFYDVDSGAILLDGHDLREYQLSGLRSQIALVDQQVRLFNASVADNIAYGLDPRPSESRIVEAAKLAYAWEFIEKLPRGLATPVGQNGSNLSGGQRQRLAIARAILKNAPILILDEATSALDTESERYIQAALDKLVVGRTTLVIAHRLSTIQRADLIAVMQEGRVVESGRHEQLLARGGVYAMLHRMAEHADAA